MYKKLFGIALLAHILIFAYIGLRPGGQPSASEAPESDGMPQGLDAEENGRPSDEIDDLLEEVAPEVEKIAYVDAFPDPVFDALPNHIPADDVKSGLLYDYTNNRVLWEKNSEQPVRIASMTKMMTALLVFEDEASRDDLSMDTIVDVTDAAYRIGGSQVWLDPREKFTLEELLITVMVKSANDSSYLVGEYISGGSMDLFVERMNQRALELKMGATRFYNAHGLPHGDTGNTASCQDLVRLAIALMQFDKALEWASIPTYDFRADSGKPTILANHNRLVSTTQGVDGLKTGYTKGAGYCVTATCLRDGRRIIAVTTGFKSSKRRDAFTKDLIDWGYRQ